MAWGSASAVRGAAALLLLAAVVLGAGKDVISPTEREQPIPPLKPDPSTNNTTTVPPTTTNTTTEAPTTTTTAPTPPPTPPTPTPNPKPRPPTPPPVAATWVWTDTKTNISCVMVNFAVQFKVNYTLKDGSLGNTSFNLPNDSVVTNGSCGNQSQWIELSWPKGDLGNKLSVEFARNDTAQKYYAHKVAVLLQFNADIFSDAASNESLILTNTDEEWGTSLTNAYRCMKHQVIKMSVNATSGSAEMTVSELTEQAFRTEKGQKFSIAQDCEPADVPDVVPIAVGCALGGLVLVVLAAYLVGRRRSQARGYLSM